MRMLGTNNTSGKTQSTSEKSKPGITNIKKSGNKPGKKQNDESDDEDDGNEDDEEDIEDLENARVTYQEVERYVLGLG